MLGVCGLDDILNTFQFPFLINSINGLTNNESEVLSTVFFF